MQLTERIAQTQQTYDSLEADRKAHLDKANEILIEMTRLQGEYRLLEILVKEEAEKTVEKPKKEKR